MHIILYKKTQKKHKKICDNLNITEVCTPTKAPVISPDYIINWGCSTIPEWFFNTTTQWINSPLSVYNSASKITSFNLFKQNLIPTLDYFTLGDNLQDVEESFNLLEDNLIVVRKLTRSSKGKGIEILPFNENLPQAPLYTIYKECKHEVRVFVVNERYVNHIEKKKMSRQKREEKNIILDKYIKSYNKGWVFCVNNKVVITEKTKDIAIKAIKSLDLNFGAVDMIFDDPDNPYVLEVNTAPALTSLTTSQQLVQAIEKMLK